MVSASRRSQEAQGPSGSPAGDAAVRANRRRERNAQLRAARKLRRQQGVDSRCDPSPPERPLRRPGRGGSPRERASRRGGLPGDPGAVTAAPRRASPILAGRRRRMRYPDGGRLLVGRRALQRARLDQTDYDRQHRPYECSQRNGLGIETDHGYFDRETTRRLIAGSEPWGDSLGGPPVERAPTSRAPRSSGLANAGPLQPLVPRRCALLDAERVGPIRRGAAAPPRLDEGTPGLRVHGRGWRGGWFA